jgi:outer membrane protein OmpA-like peptidoglycan-associated protein
VNARTIYFDSGRATLKPTSKKALRDVVGTLRADPTSTVRLVGHTDAVGAERNNKTLARARANTVATYLKRHGIGGRRIHAVGMGEAGPIADNATEQGRAKNRRVEIRVDTKTASVR